jgi:ubiquitin-protein ligase
MERFTKRISHDITQSIRSPDYDFLEDHNCENEYYMKFTVKDGLYANQTHIIHIKLRYGRSPDLYFYPLNPPLCTMVTPIWHPNIDISGIICVDNLKNEGWIPKMTIDNIFTTITLLLLEPNPDSPQNINAGTQYVNDYDSFKIIATNYFSNNNGEKKIKEVLINTNILT